MRWFCSLLALAAVAAVDLSGCSARLDPPEQRGELVVAIRNTPAYYQEEDGAASGFEHDLVELFGNELGVKTRFVVARDDAELLALLQQGKVHFAAAAPLAKQDGVRFSSPLREAGQVLVQHADTPPIDDFADLSGKKIEVLRGSPQAELLSAKNALQPPFALVVQDGMTEIDLLERVSQRKSELAATDDFHFSIAVNYFPDLEIAQELEGKVRFGWAFAENDDAALLAKAQAFIERIRQDGTLARVDDRYFGHIRRINHAGISDFIERIHSLLPHFRREFITAQTITGIDWRLLAALAYQESAWNPLATSSTNVRGIMMLTEDTADRLHVDNRLDPKQSILAGAKYLADLIDQLPVAAKEPDRTWLGLAAYNLGQGHLNGARAIALGLKRDPGSWYEMKQVLPLMARPQYYKRLKSGRARGGEAVIMVENVRTFYSILSRFEYAYKASTYAAPMLSIPPM